MGPLAYLPGLSPSENPGSAAVETGVRALFAPGPVEVVPRPPDLLPDY